MELKEALKAKAILDEYNKAHPAPETTEKYHLSDVGNGQRLVDMFGADIRFCFPWGVWFVWNGRYWEQDKTGEMARRCKKTVHLMFEEAIEIKDADKKKEFLRFCLRSEAESRLNSMASCASSELGIPVLPEQLDKDPWILNVQNGTIDLKTGQLRPHKQSDMLTKMSPVIYDPSATAPVWDAFLKKIFQDNINIISYIQRKSGYCLTGVTQEEDIDILWGTGGNGKSKLTGAIIYVLGDYHTKANIESILETSNKNGSSASPDIACLKGARLVTVSEPEKGAKLNESRVKDLTGRDPIKARHLHKDPFEFIPEFKLWVYTNFKPHIRGQDRGIWRRVKLIPFEVTIPEEEQDKELPLKLQKEASGILNWMLKGCLDWQREGLKVPDEILQATAEYKEEMDVFSEFFSYTCVIKKDGTEYLAVLYTVYKAWCRMKEIIPFSTKKFVSNLVERGFKKLPKDNKGVKVTGVTLSETVKTMYDVNKSMWGAIESDEVTYMTQNLINLSNESYVKEFIEKYVTSVTPSLKPPTDNEKQEQSKTQKVTQICGICQKPLNGNVEKIGLGLGLIHPSCKFNLIQIKALVDIPSFKAIDNITRSIKTGEVREVPILNALALISKKAAIKIELGVVVEA